MILVHISNCLKSHNRTEMKCQNLRTHKLFSALLLLTHTSIWLIIHIYQVTHLNIIYMSLSVWLKSVYILHSILTHHPEAFGDIIIINSYLQQNIQYIHIYIPWIIKFVPKTVGTNYKYTNIHNLYYKQFQNSVVDYHSK